jgi:Ca-activated chloride channel family protein
MDVVFSNQYAGLLGLILGLIIAVTIYARQSKKARAMTFGNYDTLQKVAGGKFIRSSNILTVVKLLAVTSLIAGISGPQLVQEDMVADANYVIALDSSSSMFTTDIEPTRFDAAKQISQGVIDDMTNETSLGIISYSGSVQTESEISQDLEHKRRVIENITIGETAGTAIGDAIISSGSLLDSREGDKKVILLTDGANNVGSSINKSIRYAQESNISVYTIGLGTSEEQDEYGIIEGNNATRAGFDNLDIEELNRLSNQTGGESILVTESTKVDPEFVGIEQEDVRTNLSNFFILAGCVLLLIEWLLKSTGVEVIP